MIPWIHFQKNIDPGATSPVMCLLALNGTLSCLGRKAGDQIRSLCAESFDCTWDVKIPKDQPFALIFISESWLLMDKELVDVAIFSPEPLGPQDPRRKKLDALARQEAATLAPPSAFSQEAERRERPWQVFLLGDCPNSCRLRQSSVTITLNQ